jgi:hypothetical protein
MAGNPNKMAARIAPIVCPVRRAAASIPPAAPLRESGAADGIELGHAAAAAPERRRPSRHPNAFSVRSTKSPSVTDIS